MFRALCIGRVRFTSTFSKFMKRSASPNQMSEDSKISRPTLQIGTHDGSFHVDEALACYILRQTDEFAGAEVVRSRDPALLATLPILCDVGAVYDPATKRFDHHQRSFVDTFDEKHDVRLSSAGLIYKHYGREVVAKCIGNAPSADVVELVYQKVYDDFILALDGVDNGVPQYPPELKPRYVIHTSLPARVGRLNPEWNEDASKIDMNARFAKAMQMAGEEFADYVHHVANVWLPGRSIIVSAMDASKEIDPSGQIVVTEQFCPWKDHLLEQEVERNCVGSVKYILYPDASGSWRIQAVPARADSFESRHPLPKAWRGIRDAELAALTGIAHCVFVHANGFIGGNKTREGALQMARVALTMPRDPQ